MKTKLFISVLAFMALTTLVVAQSTDASAPQSQPGTGKAAAYVDANNNGICDNFENKTPNAQNCRRMGPNNCCGMGRGQAQGSGQGMGQNRPGMGQCKGNGRNSVDNDKNGICDNREAAAKSKIVL